MTRKQRGFFRPAPRHNEAETEWGPPSSNPPPRLQEADPADFGPADPAGLEDFDPDAFEPDELAERHHSPSLPIILFSAASGVAAGVIALFVSYRWLQWGIELSAGRATLALLFGLGISGAILSAATGSRAAPVNILFSCGVILLATFFLALCLLVGALFSTLLVQF